MAEIINLRRAAKARARDAAAQQAATNRALFGQGKAARSAQRAEAERLTRTLDGAKRQAETLTSQTGIPKGPPLMPRTLSDA